MIPWEVEAKLTLERAEDARAIATLRTLGRHPLRVLPAQRLRTIYLDTPTFSLSRHAVALRVRRDGSTWEATAKWGGRVDGPVHQRAELTVPLAEPPRFPFALPSGPLATRLTALVAGLELRPILITDIMRQRRVVIARNDETIIAEIAIDRVMLRLPRRRQAEAAYWEVEIELRDGMRRDIVRLAHLLRRRYTLTPSTESKFTRGLRIFHPQVSSSVPTPSDASDTVTAAARKVVAKHLLRVQQNDPGTRDGNDPEAVHDMRVAIRRLRAAVRAFKPGFPRPLRRSLKDELSWLGQVLGDVRDIDVQLQHLDKQRKRVRGCEPLRRHLLALRRRRRIPLKAALDSPRYLQLIAALDGFVLSSDASGGEKPVGRRGKRVLHKAFRRLMKEGSRAMADPTPERLHALRISAKHTRYLLEFLKEMTGRRGQRLTRTLVALQDTLGMQHDAVVAVSTSGEVIRQLASSNTRSSPAGLRGFVAAQQRDATRYRRRAQALWRDIEKPRVAKSMEAVIDALSKAARSEG